MFLPYADDKPTDPGSPWITRILIAANVIVWLKTGLDEAYPREAWGFIPDRIALDWGFIPALPSVATSLTSLFLHGNLMHLLGNMWFLHLFGDNVELRMGKVCYAVGYLFAGLAGNFAYWLMDPNSMMPGIGASGSIFGVMGMYLFLFPYNRVRFLLFIFIIVTTVHLHAFLAIAYFFVMEMFMTYASAHMQVQTGVGHAAHAGGCLCGFLYALGGTLFGLFRNDGWTLIDWLRGKDRPTRPASAAKGAPSTVDEAPSAEVIAALVRSDRLDEAHRLWRREAHSNAALVLPPRELLTLALHMDKAGDAGAARMAYERILEHYEGTQPFEAEAGLALAGMILQQFRHSGDASELGFAAGLLRRVAACHPTAERAELARRWLHAVENKA